MAELNPRESLEKSKDDLPSNETIIDSLITNVANVKVDNNLEETIPSANFSEANSSTIKDSSNLPVNIEGDAQYDGEHCEATKCDEDADFIDEEHLKDVEVDYTEDDKKKYKDEAEQLKNCGNNKFKGGEYKEAALEYTKALRICPLAFDKDRAILYANRGAAKLKLHLTESAIEDCTKAVELDTRYLKAYLRRAQLYEQTDKLDEALADYKKILEIDPYHRESIVACQRLPDQINEKNEKLKTEMLGKLKDLGNMILKPFGLSTNNFQMVKDPNSGGYSVNFTQNPANQS